MSVKTIKCSYNKNNKDKENNEGQSTMEDNYNERYCTCQMRIYSITSAIDKIVQDHKDLI